MWTISRLRSKWEELTGEGTNIQASAAAKADAINYQYHPFLRYFL